MVRQLNILTAAAVGIVTGDFIARTVRQLSGQMELSPGIWTGNGFLGSRYDQFSDRISFSWPNKQRLLLSYPRRGIFRDIQQNHLVPQMLVYGSNL